MSDRFATDCPIDGEVAELSGPEAHHLLHVMRRGVGARVTLVDGSGFEFLAEVTAVSRRDATLAIVERRLVDRELAHTMVMGVALPKGDRQKVLVEKLTELGVARLVPLETERGVATASAGSIDKLRRAVVEASKQCRRTRWMGIEPAPLAAFLADPWGDVATPEAGRRLIAHPGGDTLVGSLFDSPVAVAVGPEGGFSDAEVELATAAGWRPVSLGPRVLRIETAAIALAAIVAAADAVRGG
jgi:16S rRNA (uracil1498-N3)-methyltransferase